MLRNRLKRKKRKRRRVRKSKWEKLHSISTEQETVISQPESDVEVFPPLRQCPLRFLALDLVSLLLSLTFTGTRPIQVNCWYPHMLPWPTSLSTSTPLDHPFITPCCWQFLVFWDPAQANCLDDTCCLAQSCWPLLGRSLYLLRWCWGHCGSPLYSCVSCKKYKKMKFVVQDLEIILMQFFQHCLLLLRFIFWKDLGFSFLDFCCVVISYDQHSNQEREREHELALRQCHNFGWKNLFFL